MPYPTNRPYSEVVLNESTTSIATTPVAVTAVSPVSGMVTTMGAGAGGTTTGTIAVSITINGGSDITGGALTVAAGTGARAGSTLDLPQVGSSAVYVNAGDLFTITPSGGTGATIPGAFFICVRGT